MISLALKYKPLKYLVGFNLATLFIFLTAPVFWKTENLFVFFLFFIFCQIALGLGFKIGADGVKNKINYIPEPNKRFINFVFVFYVCTFLIKYAYLLKFYPHQIGEMINFLLIGIASPQLGYQMSIDPSRGFTIPWSIYAVISVVNQLFFIIGFIYWKYSNLSKKIIFIIFLAIEFFFWFGRGTNFGVINLIVTFLLVMFVNNSIKKIKLTQKIKRTVVIVLLGIAGLGVFTYNLVERGGGGEVNSSELSLGRSEIDENNSFLNSLPKSLVPTYLFTVYYVSQGYYHTCLAFDLDFHFTYFLGNNPETINIGNIMGMEVDKETYVYRLNQKGIDPKINWHSIYTWLASDFSFFGVPFIFFIMGAMLGHSWVSSIKHQDFISKIIFVITGNILIFSFANNNYFGSIFYSGTIVIIYWYITRVKGIKV
ncbi:O-antigen polymerase [Sphingobacterium lactis]|uniref:O-antigen polymerase n=1 Tax=Sphingobacterium lactis TaxID=797291 RepID=UPI003F819FDC